MTPDEIKEANLAVAASKIMQQIYRERLDSPEKFNKFFDGAPKINLKKKMEKIGLTKKG